MDYRKFNSQSFNQPKKHAHFLGTSKTTPGSKLNLENTVDDYALENFGGHILYPGYRSKTENFLDCLWIFVPTKVDQNSKTATNISWGHALHFSFQSLHTSCPPGLAIKRGSGGGGKTGRLKMGAST